MVLDFETRTNDGVRSSSIVNSLLIDHSLLRSREGTEIIIFSDPDDKVEVEIIELILVTPDLIKLN